MDLAEWTADALCRGLAPDPWYPPLESPTPNDYYAVAREVCNRCPAWRSCLEYSYRNKDDEKYGMWGGLTPQERNGKKTAMRAHGTITRYRQGCTCAKCSGAMNTKKPHLDLSVYPRAGQPVNIDELKYQILPNR